MSEKNIVLEIRGENGLHVILGKLDSKRWQLAKRFIDEWMEMMEKEGAKP